MPARVAITFGEPIWPDSDTSDKNNGSCKTYVLADSDALIVQWGQQILTLAQSASTPVELASQRKRRNRT